MIAGGLTFAGAYLTSAGVGIAVEDGILAVPVVGPFIEGSRLLASEVHACTSISGICLLATYGAVMSRVAGALLIVDGLAQVLGVTLFSVGLAARRDELVDDHARLSFHPLVSATFSGMTVAGSF